MNAYWETENDNMYRFLSGQERPNENLDSYEHLEAKRKVVENDINNLEYTLRKEFENHE